MGNFLPPAVELANDLSSAVFPMNFDKRVFKNKSQILGESRPRSDNSFGVAGIQSQPALRSAPNDEDQT
ncbi:hypothetical protein EVAR_61978_1 [Eumeta japonica]|uniref:Uncharacterized protein n=1 Tax=Eumeta variegata TaxID=151549 RepID=A0A4C1YI55_EUMVA|nr:hypothetical protein EVAR_61978_1 [Eumeta japonica]